MPLQKWTVAASKVVLSDRWMHLRSERVATQRGATLDPYYVIEYPDWAVVVAITPDDQLVLVRQYRHGIGAMTLELPGGVIDAGDADPLTGAIRELAEETGYRSADVRHVSSLPTNPATQTNRLHTFVAVGAVKATEASPDAGEDLQVELLSVSQVLAGLSSGLIGQSMHVQAIVLGLAAAGRITLG
jgi:8-oxo-dGTP pyrophosphatase MutT (NUDIX family)